MKISRIAAAAAWCVLGVASPSLCAAATYYVTSGGTGNDSDTGTSAVNAWATLNKVNAAPVSGDTVLFKTGDTWEGTLKLKNGVTYGSYTPPFVSTAKPVIKGSAKVGTLTWSVDSGNVWVADASSVVANETDMYGNTVTGGISQLYLNGQRLTRARYPNAGSGAFGKGANRFLKVGGGTAHVASYLQNVEVDAATVTALAGKDLQNAEVFVKNNDWFMTRYTSTASGLVSGNLLALQAENKNAIPLYANDRHANHDGDWPGVTDYPIEAAYGFWLENKRWMLDAPGEWTYDPVTKKLYVWMPTSGSPQNTALTAAVRRHGISGYNVSSVNIDGIEVQETRSDGIKIDGYDNLVSTLALSNLTVRNAGRKGIYVINTSSSATGTISNALVEDPINEGIDLSGDRQWAASKAKRINVTGSTVRRAGQGYYARGAILLGHRGNATGNTIENSSYIGLHVGKLNTVSDNVVKSSCLAFDDCGGIYAGGSYYDISTYETTSWGAYDVVATIASNFVDGLLVNDDRLDGSGQSNGQNIGARKTTAGGIYLDDFASNVVVNNNYVSGGDTGIVVHQGSDNTITANKLVNNRYQVWLQENLGTGYALDGNSISGNTFASSASEPLIYQQSTSGGTSNFAAFNNNRYASYRSMEFAVDEGTTTTGSRFKTFAQWTGSGKDAASSLHATSYGVQIAAGASQMIGTGVFTGALDNNGWYAFQATLPVEGNFVTVLPDSGADVVNGKRRFGVTPGLPMSIVKGQKYWLSFDAKADGGAEIAIAFRRDSSPYDDQSVPINVPASSSWQSFSRLITAEETLSNSGFGFTFYVDSSLSTSGSKVRLNNVYLRKADIVTGNAGAAGVYNAGASAISYACPNPNTALCSSYIDLSTGSAVSFPLSIASKTARVVGLNTGLWLDPDRDGIPGDSTSGGRDTCASTADGVNVKETGCPY